MARRATLPPPAKWGKLQQLTLVGQLDALRGMAWAFAVVFHTGLSARAISRKFSPPDVALDANEDIVVSNIMYQYLDGKRSPMIGPRGKLKFDLVGAIDKDSMGRLATPWLNHPVFEVFHPTTSLARVREILFAMPSEIQAELFRQTSDRPDPFYDRLSAFTDTCLLNLFRMGTLDAFTAICAICREGQMTGNRRQAGEALVMLTTKPAAFFEMDPVFSYVAWPFFKMLTLFYDHDDLRMRESVSVAELKGLDRPVAERLGFDSVTDYPRLDIDWRVHECETMADAIPTDLMNEFTRQATGKPFGLTLSEFLAANSIRYRGESECSIMPRVPDVSTKNSVSKSSSTRAPHTLRRSNGLSKEEAAKLRPILDPAVQPKHTTMEKIEKAVQEVMAAQSTSRKSR